ncbi:glutamine synthetase family protein [Gammaproteobacteria bacterium]|nr:glutamine synthetase family protein [Gammaproteobacteria bacterium]
MTEVAEFLARHPEINEIDCLLPDNNALMRGKRLERASLAKAFDHGIALPASVFALDVHGDTVEATGLGFDSGDADYLCFPIPGTLAPHGLRAGRGQLLMEMMGRGDRPYALSPRAALGGINERLAGRGLRAVVAVELEFYLIDRERAPDGGLQTPKLASGRHDYSSQVYSTSDLDDYADFLRDVQTAAQAQGVPVGAAVAEAAPGQFEVNLIHRDDPLRACDDALLLKSIVRQAADRHGHIATFMAKPWSSMTGNGLHLHVSVIDESGQNIFAEGEPEDNVRLGHCVAGLLDTLVESQFLFAPHVNSYRRMQPEMYVPLAPTWGVNNRSVAVRIPFSESAARRVEHRVAGADANPYLVCAAVLAGMLDGLENESDPGAPIVGNAYQQVEPCLLPDMRSALARFEHSSFIQRYFPQPLIDNLVVLGYHEIDLFERQVSSLDLDWFLRL